MQTEPPSSAQESKPDVEPNMESPWNSLLDLEQFTEPLPTEPFEELVRRKIAVCHELLMQYQIRDRPLQGNYWRVIAHQSPGQFILHKYVIGTILFHGFPFSCV